MKAKTIIRIEPGIDGFAEDKQAAREIRESTILPALAGGQKVVIDFKKVSSATQSYVHALVGEALKRYEEKTLDLIEFKNCTPTVRSVIELVVDYSLGGFATGAGVA